MSAFATPGSRARGPKRPSRQRGAPAPRFQRFLGSSTFPLARSRSGNILCTFAVFARVGGPTGHNPAYNAAPNAGYRKRDRASGPERRTRGRRRTGRGVGRGRGVPRRPRRRRDEEEPAPAARRAARGGRGQPRRAPDHAGRGGLGQRRRRTTPSSPWTGTSESRRSRLRSFPSNPPSSPAGSVTWSSTAASSRTRSGCSAGTAPEHPLAAPTPLPELGGHRDRGRAAVGTAPEPSQPARRRRPVAFVALVPLLWALRGGRPGRGAAAALRVRRRLLRLPAELAGRVRHHRVAAAGR